MIRSKREGAKKEKAGVACGEDTGVEDRQRPSGSSGRRKTAFTVLNREENGGADQ